jgi:hypothetical protein
MVTGTGFMWKVTQVATGVAGSPYYLTGYFDGYGGTAQNAADAWRAMLSGGVSTYTAPLIFQPIIEVQQVDPTNGNLIATSIVSVLGQTFTGAGDPLPPATSLLLRWRTGAYVGGREIRGRTNIPRQAETDSTLGVPTTTLLATWQARQTALLATANAKHVVWSPKNGVWAQTVGASPWSQWAVLRSRRD